MIHVLYLRVKTTVLTPLDIIILRNVDFLKKSKRKLARTDNL